LHRTTSEEAIQTVLEKAGVNHKMEFDEDIDAINRIPKKSPSVAETVSTKRYSSINRLKLQCQIT
ncbi:MAG: hypothetical protein SPF90_01520, partial [Bacteroidaceae bacterium]|nr:hypothetical protein [Bacteroidaceae bacterium]